MLIRRVTRRALMTARHVPGIHRYDAPAISWGAPGATVNAIVKQMLLNEFDWTARRIEYDDLVAV